MCDSNTDFGLWYEALPAFNLPKRNIIYSFDNLLTSKVWQSWMTKVLNIRLCLDLHLGRLEQCCRMK